MDVASWCTTRPAGGTSQRGIPHWRGTEGRCRGSGSCWCRSTAGPFQCPRSSGRTFGNHEFTFPLVPATSTYDLAKLLEISSSSSPTVATSSGFQSPCGCATSETTKVRVMVAQATFPSRTYGCAYWPLGRLRLLRRR